MIAKTLSSRQHRFYMVLTNHGLAPHIKDLDKLLGELAAAVSAKGNSPKFKGDKAKSAQDYARTKLTRKNLF